METLRTGRHSGQDSSRRLRERVRDLPLDEKGITGLETAIVLIAFVVVASVFAFAVLTTGLLSSEKAKETVLGALAETQAALHLKGIVVAKGNTSTPPTFVTSVEFLVGSAAGASEPVNLADDQVTITYIDADNAVNVPSTYWTATWLSGLPSQLDPEEQVQFEVTLDGLLSPVLGPSKRFTIQVTPNVGPPLAVSRRTPPELRLAMNLD